jgi:hypothetical protein
MGDFEAEYGKSEAAFRTIMLRRRAIEALKSTPRPIQADALVFPASGGGYINLDNRRVRVWKNASRPPG